MKRHCRIITWSIQISILSHRVIQDVGQNTSFIHSCTGRCYITTVGCGLWLLSITRSDVFIDTNCRKREKEGDACDGLSHASIQVKCTIYAFLCGRIAENKKI